MDALTLKFSQTRQLLLRKKDVLSYAEVARPSASFLAVHHPSMSGMPVQQRAIYHGLNDAYGVVHMISFLTSPEADDFMQRKPKFHYLFSWCSDAKRRSFPRESFSSQS